MYTTKSAQNLTEHKTWSNQNGDKNFLRKRPGVSDDVSLQIQCLCAQFIKEKLKRDGLSTRKISILIDVLPNPSLRHTVVIINRMSLELERLHPRTFCNISLAVPPVAAPVMVESIGRSLFKHNDVSWGKIISFLTISSAIASDCARVGQPDLIQAVVDSTFAVMSDEAGPWIEKEGGWNALSDYIRPIGSEHMSFLGWLTLMVGFLLTVHWTWMILKFIGRQILNIL